ncbi:MAG: hypothetical protein KGQ75_09900 [Sphingomonadales bacterium]|nr:hypothetical protein [Sphingomonadales bacterium]
MRLRSPWIAALWITAAISTPATLIAANTAKPAATSGSVPGTVALARVQNSDLLLFAVELDGGPLTDSLAVYGDPTDPLIPLAELARLLDLDVQVRPQEGIATGRIGERQSSLTIDLPKGIARTDERSIALTEGAAAVGANDVFVKRAVLEALLPLKVTVDGDESAIKLIATEKLPLQAKRERAARRPVNDVDALAQEAVLAVRSDYRMLGRPGFDISGELGTDNARGGLVSRLEGRMALDVLNSAFSGYIATDDRGKPSTARVMLSRRSEEGRMLGGLRATYLGLGDVFTPIMPLGLRSLGGRGIAISTRRQDDASVFDRITLRGELPLGYDVELYVNDILRSGQNTPVQGRYEFIDVPVVRGLNIIRIVSYGPHGERQEQTRVISVGGGQLPAGRFSFDAGLVEQDRAMIAFPGAQPPGDLARGRLRGNLNLAYGVSTSLTATAALGTWSTPAGKRRGIAALGLRTSLLGAAVQLDAAADFSRGKAGSLSLAGRLGPLSYFLRESEYRGNFQDENNALFDPSRAMRRYTQAALDLSTPIPGGARLPISVQLDRSQFEDGGTAWNAQARSSLLVAGTITALGVQYSRTTRAGITNKQMSVNVAASRLINYNWQLRGSADYDVAPRTGLRALALTADRRLSNRYALRLGAAKSFGKVKDLTLQGGIVGHLPFADMTLSGDYSTQQKRWRIGLQFNIGMAFNPFRERYALTPPGPANGASAALEAFVDENGNGKRDRGEEPVPDIGIEGAGKRATTDSNGHAFVTGLGDGRSGRLRVDTSKIDTTFFATPPQFVGYNARAGDVLRIPYPLVPTSELVFRLQLRRADGKLAGIAAVKVWLVSEKGERVFGSTEFDGAVMFESVKPGRYHLELDADQAKRLHMHLVRPVEVEVATHGRAMTNLAEIEFERTT